MIYKDCDIKTLSLFKIGDKIIDKIEEIFYFIKAKNRNKQAINVTNNVIMFFKRSQNYNSYAVGKKKANSNEQYYNCNKLKHYRRDYNQPNCKK